MIRVWSEGNFAGVLDRFRSRGSTFAYDPEALPERSVSLTMPVRVASWDTAVGLAPIFEMNLPEGALREKLTRRFAKAAGSFDNIDLLSVVGRTQIGRLRYSGSRETLSEDVPFQSIDEILRARRGGTLFDFLLEKFAAHSGLSGVQPKVMIRAEEEDDSVKGTQERLSSIRSATHIIKLWNENEYPELAANEFFCLSVAQNMGLDVPSFTLSNDGLALVVERFDLRNGSYSGFEDFCVLNALPTADKYKGGYETRLFKRLREFTSPSSYPKEAKNLFKLFALNCAIRNGDAHLKNFGVTYDDIIRGEVSLAPVYDLVTTAAYQPKDPMALTLNGSTNWPTRQQLTHLGQSRADLSSKEVERIFALIADSMAKTKKHLYRYFNDSPFPDIGKLMSSAWEEGIKESLGFSARPKRGRISPPIPKETARIAKSDRMLLETLRKNGGVYVGSQRRVAAELGFAPSTISMSINRLMVGGYIRHSKSGIELLEPGWKLHF